MCGEELWQFVGDAGLEKCYRRCSQLDAFGSYQGELDIAGLPSGQGELWSTDRTYHYVGEFSSGLRHGQGRDVEADGDKYDGQWARGKKHGKGTHVSEVEGETYVGDWVDDYLEGTGVLRLTDGSSYEGEFEGGYRHGKGVFIDAHGVRQEGKFEYDVYVGPK